MIGGLGNGVQWIALVTAVQELTSAAYQARVLALLEALASAMPGAGFLLGGAIAALFEPRVSYAVAGAGVLVVPRASPPGHAAARRLGAGARAGPRRASGPDGASSVAGAHTLGHGAHRSLTLR